MDQRYVIGTHSSAVSDSKHIRCSELRISYSRGDTLNTRHIDINTSPIVVDSGPDIGNEKNFLEGQGDRGGN